MIDLADVAKLVDAYVTKKAERLKADQAAAALKEEETALKSLLLKIAIDSKAKSLGGTIATLNYHRKNKPKVDNWDKFYAYIKEHDAWDLLQKRAGEKAIEERWEDNIVIPGVVTFPVDDFTVVGRT